VYVSLRSGAKNIWRINIDGSNPIQLSKGLADSFASISPDGKWVVFTSLSGSKPTIWKVSIDGGTAQQVTDHAALSAKFSPDGKMLVYQYADAPDAFAPPNKVVVMPLEGGEVSREFPLATSSTAAAVAEWSPDGKAILYSTVTNNVSNIWSQPIDGGAPKQITDFKDSLITGFTFSKDGKQLICTRGILLRDAVLITDVK
jgi:TolB protein